MQKVDGDIGEDVENSGEDEPAISKNSFGKPEQDITKTPFEEALEDVCLPAAEDNVEDISDLSEREHEIKDDATSIEVMNTLIEALEDFADRIFLYCDAVDMMKPLQDDSLGEDLSDTSDSDQDDGRRSLSLNCTVLSPY